MAYLFEPPLNYERVSLWGWTIFGMFIVFPPTWAWQFWRMSSDSGAKSYQNAENYIRIIKLAMSGANLSKLEQQFQWRQVFTRLADEFRVGTPPPPPGDTLTAHAEVIPRDTPAPG